MNTIQWQVTYKNGDILKQYDDAKTNSYEDIDRDNLASFALYKDDKCLINIHLSENQRLIFRKRVKQTVGGVAVVCYLAGWQMKIAGENVQSIAYVFEDGHIELAGKWDENSSWFYAPVLIDQEL